MKGHRIFARILGLLIGFAMLGELLSAQQEAPPCQASVVTSTPVWTPPPWAVVSSVTEISKSNGGCPPNSCHAKVRLEVDVTSPDAPGPNFYVCVNLSCFPTSLPHNPGKPWYTQSFYGDVDLTEICGATVEAGLYMNPGLGFLPLATATLSCGQCP